MAGGIIVWQVGSRRQDDEFHEDDRNLDDTLNWKREEKAAPGEQLKITITLLGGYDPAFVSVFRCEIRTKRRGQLFWKTKSQKSKDNRTCIAEVPAPT